MVVHTDDTVYVTLSYNLGVSRGITEFLHAIGFGVFSPQARTFPVHPDLWGLLCHVCGSLSSCLFSREPGPTEIFVLLSQLQNEPHFPGRWAIVTTSSPLKYQH